MKVLVCIPCLLNGGAEVQTLSLVERYRAAGVDVKLLSPDGVRPQGLKAIVRILYSRLRAVVKWGN